MDSGEGPRIVSIIISTDVAQQPAGFGYVSAAGRASAIDALLFAASSEHRQEIRTFADGRLLGSLIDELFAEEELAI